MSRSGTPLWGSRFEGRAARALRRLSGRVQGLTFDEGTWRSPVPGTGLVEASVACRGWSPLFHRVRFDAAIRVDVDAVSTEDDMVVSGALASGLDPYLEVQRGIARAASAHGIPAPLSLPGSTSSREAAHVMICAGLLRAMDDDGALPHIAERIAVVTNGSFESPGRRFMRHVSSTDFALLSMLHLDDADRPTLSMPHERATAGRTTIAFCGHRVIVPASLPDSTLAHAVGRRLRDVVVTGVAPYDDARILSTSLNERHGGGAPGIGFEVDTPLVRLGDRFGARA